MREPYRERLSIIVNELGIGLAGRGEDLNDVIRRANPALKEVDEVLRLLAKQNDQLESLAVDGDTIMQPLARERAHVSSAIENMSAVAEATADRRADLEADFERLPRFLRELRPTMTRLGALSDEMTPVLSDLGDVAPDINRFLLELGPFSQAGIPALDSLGEAAKIGTPAVRNSLPVVRDLRTFASAARPVGESLADVLVSFRRNKGIERADGLHLLPGGRGQRLRLLRPLPARRPDRQPVLVLRGRADRRLLGELPHGGVRDRRRRRVDAARPGARVDRARAARAGSAHAAEARAQERAQARRRAGPARQARARRGPDPPPARRGRGARPGGDARAGSRPAGARARRRRPRPRRRPRRRRLRPAATPPFRCSTTCSEAATDARARQRHRRQPGADRRGDRAGRDRGGLPLLQREPGAAVRPDVRAQGADAERRQPGARQRGADRRHARRLGRLDHRPAQAGRHQHGRARAQARALGLAAAEGHQGADPAALGARPEVRRADARHVRRRASTTATRSRSHRRRPRRSSSTSS